MEELKKEREKEFDKFHKGIHQRGVCQFGQIKQFLLESIEKAYLKGFSEGYDEAYEEATQRIKDFRKKS